MTTTGSFFLILNVVSGINQGVQCIGMKFQDNAYENEIRRYGMSGDVAGALMKTIQADVVPSLQGLAKSSLQNFVGVEELDESEYKSYLAMGLNTVRRAGSNFFVDGNVAVNEDFASPLSRLSTKILVTLLSNKIARYVKTKIVSRNISDSNVRDMLDTYLSNIIETNRFASFSYDVSYDRASRSIAINIYAEEKQLVKRITFYLTKLETQ